MGEAHLKDLLGKDIPDKEFALTPTERKKLHRKSTQPKGHAGTPGRGPAGETCGTCAAYTLRNGGARNYRKCFKNRGRWTGGPGSDIRKKDPACELFVPHSPELDAVAKKLDQMYFASPERTAVERERDRLLWPELQKDKAT